MHHRLPPGALLLPTLLLLAGAATAQDEGLRRCRALTDAPARLACYDALPLLPVPAGAPAATATAKQLAAPVPAAPTQPAAGPATFGLEQPAPQVQQIESSLPGRFEGWGPRTQLRLANGQVWQISDDSSAVYDLLDPKVTVRRAAMGSFMMDIEGARRSPRVKRVE